MSAPVGILFAAARLTAEWYVALAWRIWGPRFVGRMQSSEPLTEGPPS